MASQPRRIWAADLFAVQTVSFRTRYVFFCIRHQRKELIHFNVTASPTATWIWHQFLEATPWSRRHKYLIHDAVSGEFADYYNRDRPYRSLGLQSPIPRSVIARSRMVSRPVL